MANISLTGNDIIKINDRLLVDFADGDVATLTFPNELISMKTGKNGNAIAAFNETGKQVNVELRLLRGSADDAELNSLFLAQDRLKSAFTTLSASFTKNIGDGFGNIRSEQYDLAFGLFSQGIDIKENVDGDTEQAVSIYRLQFATAPRSL